MRGSGIRLCCGVQLATNPIARRARQSWSPQMAAGSLVLLTGAIAFDRDLMSCARFTVRHLRELRAADEAGSSAAVSEASRCTCAPLAVGGPPLPGRANKWFKSQIIALISFCPSVCPCVAVGASCRYPKPRAGADLAMCKGARGSWARLIRSAS